MESCIFRCCELKLIGVNVSFGLVRANCGFYFRRWGEKNLEGWEAAADTAIKAGATHLLGQVERAASVLSLNTHTASSFSFNEPDLAEQANMTPKKAAELWMSAMEPLAKKNVKLISPAVSNGVKTADGAPMGVPWMVEFLEACSSCTIDAVALQ